jgi:hypothetical protein
VSTKSNEERIAILETMVADMRTTQSSIETKLDDLLALRNRGIGAFWLASGLLGTGIIGALGAIFGWFKS